MPHALWGRWLPQLKELGGGALAKGSLPSPGWAHCRVECDGESGP